MPNGFDDTGDVKCEDRTMRPPEAPHERARQDESGEDVPCAVWGGADSCRVDPDEHLLRSWIRAGGSTSRRDIRAAESAVQCSLHFFSMIMRVAARSPSAACEDRGGQP
jgi:hypothetical protein